MEIKKIFKTILTFCKNHNILTSCAALATIIGLIWAIYTHFHPYKDDTALENDRHIEQTVVEQSIDGDNNTLTGNQVVNGDNSIVVGNQNGNNNTVIGSQTFNGPFINSQTVDFDGKRVWIGNNFEITDIDIMPTEFPLDLSYSNALYSQGLELFNQAYYYDAFEMFEKTLEYHESNHNADVDTGYIHISMGLAFRCLGNYDEAIKAYTKAIGLLNSIEADECGYAYYLRSIAFLEDHQLEKAMQDITVAENLLVNGEGKYYSIASVENVIGQIQFNSAYSEHSPFDTGEILGYTFRDAYGSFCRAIDDLGLDVSSDAIYDTSIPSPYLELFAFKLGETNKYVQISDDDIIYNWYEFPEDDENRLTRVVRFGNIPENNMVEHIIEIPKKYVLTKPNKEIAEILLNRALVLQCLSFHNAAIEDLETALKIYESMQPSITDKVRRICFTLAHAKLENYAFEHDGHFNEETKNEYYNLMSKALQWSLKWSGDSFETGKAYEGMALAEIIRNNWEGAITNLKKAKRIYDNNNADPGAVIYYINMLEAIKKMPNNEELEIGLITKSK